MMSSLMIEHPSKYQISASIKSLGLIIIFTSSYNKAASFSFVLSLILVNRYANIYSRRSSKKTPGELNSYNLTETALENLRRFGKDSIEYLDRYIMDSCFSYCLRPEMNVWRLVSRLRDPEQFAKFIISGSSEHVTDEEVMEHLDWISTDHKQMKHQEEGNLNQNYDTDTVGGHRFNCILCDNDSGSVRLGHRFHCRKCFLDP